jgi:hypothetical protein
MKSLGEPHVQKEIFLSSIGLLCDAMLTEQNAQIAQNRTTAQIPSKLQ